MPIQGFEQDPKTGEYVTKVTAFRSSGLPKGVRFAAALAILGVVMFIIPPGAAGYLGLLLVLGALVGTVAERKAGTAPDPAAPIRAFADMIYGGK